MMSLKILITTLILCSLKPSINSQLFESPCPNLFEYTGHNKNADEWFGKVVLLTSTDLFDVFVQLTFDKPFLKLANTFGEVVMRGSDCFIEKPNFKLSANTPHTFSFILKYRPNESPPKLVLYKLNGQLVCFETRQLKDISGNNICGTVPLNSNLERANGNITYYGQFPWNAAIYHSEGMNLNYICGASLISKDHVVTVAQCVTRWQSKTDNLKVYLGKYSLKEFSSPGIQVRKVSKIFVHVQYNAQTSDNNIALVKFTSPVEFTDYVRPICLWQESADLSSVVNELGNVLTWNSDEDGKVADTLTQVKIPVVSQETCKRKEPELYSRITSNNTYCAGPRTVWLCKYEYGNGMFFLKPGSDHNTPIWQLRGLVSILLRTSYSVFKCDTSAYVVFTDAAKYLDWINQTMTM